MTYYEKILVVGARKGSLGQAIAETLAEDEEYKVQTAGISGDEKLDLDVRSKVSLQTAVLTNYDHVVCTVGVNQETDLLAGMDDFVLGLGTQMTTNYLGPMMLLNAWLRRVRESSMRDRLHQFVVVSSNSASVPRSTSLGYCASKAALSQAIRCAARFTWGNEVIWGVEPGWIQGTPMSQEVDTRLVHQKLGLPAVKRMRGGYESERYDIANLIRCGLKMVRPQPLNGMLFRMDGGEQ